MQASLWKAQRYLRPQDLPALLVPRLRPWVPSVRLLSQYDRARSFKSSLWYRRGRNADVRCDLDFYFLLLTRHALAL